MPRHKVYTRPTRVAHGKEDGAEVPVILEES